MKIIGTSPIPDDDPIFDWLEGRRNQYQLVYFESDYKFTVGETKMRQVKYRDIGLFTDKIKIVANEPGAGGASTEYALKVETTHPSNLAIDGMRFRFQEGNPLEKVNGITNEALLSILIDRMEGFQSGEFKTREGALVLTKLEEALHWMQARTMERRARGVEGKQEK